MGGEENGEKASRTAIEQIDDWFQSLTEEDFDDGELASLCSSLEKKLKDKIEWPRLILGLFLLSFIIFSF